MNQPSDSNHDYSDFPEEFSWDEEKWERFFSAYPIEDQAEFGSEDIEEEIHYLEDILVYQLCKDLAAEAIEFVKSIHSKRRDIRMALDRLGTYATMVAAHVAAGHALGYEPETIRGNMTLCRRARRLLKECQKALMRIQSRYGVTVASLQLNHLALEVQEQLESWISELRGLCRDW